MEVKKSPKADLENKKASNLLIGVILTLSVLFIGFEWSEREVKVVTESGITEIVFEEEMIPITEQEPPKQAPPPPEAPKLEEIIEIAENDEDIEETTIDASDDIQAAVEVKGYGTAVEVEEEEVEEEQIFQVVEEMPEVPGGQAECMKWLGKNMKYPQISQENGVQGRVIVQFVVNQDGSIVDAQVVRGVDPYLDKEALRVIGNMPKWKPGKQRGKAVRVKFTLPVMFRVQ